MKKLAGKFITLEGVDGSGKATQTKILATKLKKTGHKTKIISFPQYNKKSAGLVEEYLSGKYGQAKEVNPFIASMFYALDRFDAGFKIKNWLKKGYVVIADRYTFSNLAHQGSKIKNLSARKKYFTWLNDLEYKLINIPQPDITFYLHIDAKIRQRLLNNRKTKKDIHEKNQKYLKQTEQVYLQLAKIYPNIKMIECVKNNKILSRQEIHKLIWGNIVL